MTEIVNRYLTAFYTGDFATARAVVAEDFAFRGPFIEAHGRDAFFERAAGLRGVVRGHRLLHQWVDGGDVCSIYDVQLATALQSGAVTMAEWHTVQHGMLVRGHVLFDTRAFRDIVESTRGRVAE